MDEFLVTLNNVMQSGPWFALPATFLWGMTSVLLSPCHMASIPLLVAYVAGQHQVLPLRLAARYAIFFASGLFITIVAIGVICSLLGRMLGDVGPYWSIIVGIILLWVAWPLFGPPQCSTAGGRLRRFQLKGTAGAMILGLAYGFLSGVCTFGFIAPILGLITLQNEILYGIVMLIFFAAGHCFPLVLAGMFSAGMKQIVGSLAWQNALLVMRKIAGIIIVGLGFYFISMPFLP